MPYAYPNGTLDTTTVPQITNVKDSEIPRQKGESYNKISWRFHKRDLFADAPSVNDIKQSGIGDCSLLAALLAIARKSPNTILGMMKDERGGNVVVRLYDNTGTPFAYRLEKTYLTKKNTDIAKHEAYWVYMVEKAVAVYRLRTNYNFTPISMVGGAVHRGAQRPAKTQVEALTGGQSDDIFKLLLGGNAERLGIDITDNKIAGDFFTLIMTNNGNAGDQHRAAVLQLVFGNANSPEALDFIAHYNPAAGPAAGAGFLGETGVIRHEYMQNFVAQHYPEIQAGTLQMITAYLDDTFPGKRGTGQYNAHQLDLYNRIQQALLVNRYVAVGSKSEVGGQNQFGHSGESIFKGLAGPHAYEVADCRMVGAIRYIKLRNPWGNTGREYHIINVMGPNRRFGAHQTEKGEFELELSDLTKRFNNVYIGG